MTDTNAWRKPLLSDRRFHICRAHRLSTANTDGVEGVSLADRQPQLDLQRATKEQTVDFLEKREAVERRKAAARRKAKDSLYIGSSWKKKTDSATPAKRIAAKDRVAIAMKKIAKAGQPSRSDSGTRSDSADSLVINGRMCVKNGEGDWVDVVTGEPCGE